MEEKIDGLSLITACDMDRLPILRRVLKKYASLGLADSNYEILCPSRTLKKSFEIAGLKVTVLPYSFQHVCFNPALALNIAISHAKYTSIMIVGSECEPITDVLKQLRELPLGNYICQGFDEDKGEQTRRSLVNTKYRAGLPGMSWTAVYQINDLKKINGYDMRFMEGHSWCDNNFSQFWNSQKIPYTVKDDIQVVHRFHERQNSGLEGYRINKEHFEMAQREGWDRAEYGLKEVGQEYKEGKRLWTIEEIKARIKWKAG